jgi:hypothetical protein
MKSKVRVALVIAGALLLGGVAARIMKNRGGAPASLAAATNQDTPRTQVPLEVAETIYDGKLGRGWDDWGWGPHQLGSGPARVVFEKFGGILLHHSELAGPYAALSFRYKAPAAWSGFLQVSLRWSGAPDDSFETIRVEPRHEAVLPEGWREVLIDWKELDSARRPIDRVMISSYATVGADWVQLDKILLTKLPAGMEVRSSRDIGLRVLCGGAGLPINPLIYGGSGDSWDSGQSARRIGGNPLTRANWELGAWNVGKDWYFENTGQDKTMFQIVSESAKLKRQTALVVPTIGWVAKDTSSFGFPRGDFPEQAAFDPYKADAGNGVRPDGKPIKPGSPLKTSIEAPPALIEKWVRKIADEDKERGSRAVQIYILDNEPSLWNETHRDVRPEPLGYDELLDRTIKYASAIRAADPDALIAGPAEWGWLNYHTSAVDREEGANNKDRLAHGDKPLVAWYLKALAEHERTTGQRLLDVLDLHFYPAAEGVYEKAKTDTAGSALRLRSSRGLWDPTYVDESWIGEAIRLIPRMKAWVRENYPGRKLMLGEWSFGADDHISGGLAVAEALGRFGQQGLDAAFFWGPLKKDSPVFWAFRAFRDFDGKGARFQDVSLPVQEAPMVSLFASRDERKSRLVLVVINREPAASIEAKIALDGCGPVTSSRMFSYDGGSKALSPGTADASDSGVTAKLTPFSVTVLDLKLQD